MQFFPKIRMVEFSERRIKKPLIGAVIPERAEVQLTEPVANKLSRWLDKNNNIVKLPIVSVKSHESATREQLIFIDYYVCATSKEDMAQFIYG